jgi:hypothetical protein
VGGEVLKERAMKKQLYLQYFMCMYKYRTMKNLVKKGERWNKKDGIETTEGSEFNQSPYHV